MASIFKRTIRGKESDKYYYRFLDHKDGNDVWRTVAGCSDYQATRQIAARDETKAALKRSGVEA